MGTWTGRVIGNKYAAFLKEESFNIMLGIKTTMTINILTIIAPVGPKQISLLLKKPKKTRPIKNLM